MKAAETDAEVIAEFTAAASRLRAMNEMASPRPWDYDPTPDFLPLGADAEVIVVMREVVEPLAALLEDVSHVHNLRGECLALDVARKINAAEVPPADRVSR